MLNWKAHLADILTGLSSTHGKVPLSEIRRILRGVLGVEDIRFHNSDGRELPAELTLEQALEHPCQFLALLRTERPAETPTQKETDDDLPTESRFREGPSAEPAGDLASDERYNLFLYEFIRLENNHEFMWAGYVVRELLPRLGFPAEEAKSILDRLRAEKLVIIDKVANPRNPDFPATGVRLNHEHPRVRALLAGKHAEETPDSSINDSGQGQQPTYSADS